MTDVNLARVLYLAVTFQMKFSFHFQLLDWVYGKDGKDALYIFFFA